MDTEFSWNSVNFSLSRLSTQNMNFKLHNSFVINFTACKLQIENFLVISHIKIFDTDPAVGIFLMLIFIHGQEMLEPNNALVHLMSKLVDWKVRIINKTIVFDIEIRVVLRIRTNQPESKFSLERACNQNWAYSNISLAEEEIKRFCVNFIAEDILLRLFNFRLLFLLFLLLLNNHWIFNKLGNWARTGRTKHSSFCIY